MIIRMPVDGRPKYVNTGKVRNCGAEGEVSYRINAAWTIACNYSWLHMKYPVVAAPEHKLYGSVDFSRGRWRAACSVQYVDGLYTQVDPAETEESFVLVNADAAFRLGARRKSARATLRDQRGLSHAESYRNGRHKHKFLTNKCENQSLS